MSGEVNNDGDEVQVGYVGVSGECRYFYGVIRVQMWAFGYLLALSCCGGLVTGVIC